MARSCYEPFFYEHQKCFFLPSWFQDQFLYSNFLKCVYCGTNLIVSETWIPKCFNHPSDRYGFAGSRFYAEFTTESIQQFCHILWPHHYIYWNTLACTDFKPKAQKTQALTSKKHWLA
jgi:hypothetical protein